MAVLTHALTTPAGARSIDRTTLTPAHLKLVTNALWELGIEDGHAANGDGNPNAAYRLALSAQAAATIGLHLPDGDELALCAICRTLVPSSSAHWDENTLRCTVSDANGASCRDIYLGNA